jgi:UDP-N-acetylglucosamine 1-carboxyvinyltransferase
VADHLKPLIAKLKEVDLEVTESDKGIRVKYNGHLKATDIKTLPYPGFPTDMQAQFMTLLTMAEGTSVVTETVFENRFMHVGELKRMGANIKIESRSAVIEGVQNLTGAQVKATDLRAGAALILAALAANGTTEISDIHHIERGYCNLDSKLIRLGAKITREKEPCDE